MAERVAIGRVGKPHGLDGSFVVEDASEDERWFVPGTRLLAGADEVEVLGAKRAGGRRVLRVDRALRRGTPLEVTREQLPAPEEDEYYVFQLIGLEVVEEGGRVLGTVARVEPGVANDVLVVAGGPSLPMVEECVRDVDLAAGRILVAAGFADSDPEP
jgi:16S rRNA processing protein RimM